MVGKELFIMNPGGLDTPPGLKYNPVYYYELFCDLPEVEYDQGWNAWVDISSLCKNKQITEVDTQGIHGPYPCPSKVKDWVEIYDNIMSDLLSRNVPVPKGVFVPGASAPIVFQYKHDNEILYDSACSCPDCLTTDMRLTLEEFLDYLHDEPRTVLNDELAGTDSLMKIMKARNAKIKKFDKAVRSVITKHWKDMEVHFYATHKIPSFKESVGIHDDASYAVFPSVMPNDWNGCLLMESKEDFQLGTIYKNVSSFFIKLPPFDSDDDDEDDYDLYSMFERYQLGRATDIRLIASRFIDALWG